MLAAIFNVLSVLLSLLLIIAYFIYIIFVVFYRMDPDDAKYIRTFRHPGTIDVHPNLNAIVLNYELDVQILGPNDVNLYGDKQSLQKIIDLPMLNTRTDCNAVAKEVLVQCELIHPSRLVEVEQTIYYLKKRKRAQSINDSGDNSGKNVSIDEPSNINCISEYIDLLYEDLADKIKASHLILMLAKTSENLEPLSKNEPALSALGRVLREDWKRSIILSTNLIYIFFCFSTYTCFHPILLHYKIGSLCMDIIEFELRRFENWNADLEGIYLSNDPLIITRPCKTSTSMVEINKSRIPEALRPRSGNFNDVNIKACMEGSIYDDLTNSTDSLDDKKHLSEEEKIKRLRTLIKKQEQLLRVAFYLLLNMAEDQAIEEKMTKKNIVGYLVATLNRENSELLMLVVTFLKKLSLMQVNKDEMAELNILEKLPRLLQSDKIELVHVTLKLLFNLSFDAGLRAKMVKIGLLPKFVSLLSDDKHQDIVIKLLYHLSYDREMIPQFAYTDCVSLIVDMLILNASDHVDQVMAALCINLATHPRNAQQMVDNTRLSSLLKRACRHKDTLLLKAIRNISEHDCTRAAFIEHVGDLASLVNKAEDETFLLECLGIMSNLNNPDLDWSKIFEHFDILNKLKDILTSVNTEPDLLLQIIVLLGTASNDEGCSLLLCESGITIACIDLLKIHQEDDEMVLQIMYMFLKLLSHRQSANYLIHNTEATPYIIDLVSDTNREIRKLCNICLNLITELDPEWGNRIRIERFRMHNFQWLEMVDSQLQQDDEEDDDNVLPPYLNTEYLSTATVPPSTEITPEMEVLYANENRNVQNVIFEAADDSILQEYEMDSAGELL